MKVGFSQDFHCVVKGVHFDHAVTDVLEAVPDEVSLGLVFHRHQNSSCHLIHRIPSRVNSVACSPFGNNESICLRKSCESKLSIVMYVVTPNKRAVVLTPSSTYFAAGVG